MGAPFKRMTLFVLAAMAFKRFGMLLLFSGSAPKSLANSRTCGVKIAGVCKWRKNWIAARLTVAVPPVVAFSFNVAMAFNASASMTVGAFNCGSSSKTAWTVPAFVESPGPIAIAVACFARFNKVEMCCGCRTSRHSPAQFRLELSQFPLKSAQFSFESPQSSKLQKTGSESFVCKIGAIACGTANVTSPAPLRSAASVQSAAAPGISLEPAIMSGLP